MLCQNSFHVLEGLGVGKSDVYVVEVEGERDGRRMERSVVVEASSFGHLGKTVLKRKGLGGLIISVVITGGR